VALNSVWLDVIPAERPNLPPRRCKPTTLHVLKIKTAFNHNILIPLYPNYTLTVFQETSLEYLDTNA
jgi:hypothetical protein